jgi:hypothetical protein
MSDINYREANLELRKRLSQAEALLRRGIATMRHTENGESQYEWTAAARSWVNLQESEREFMTPGGTPV